MNQTLDSSEKIKNLIAKLTLRNQYWGYLFGRIGRVASNSLPSIMGVSPTKDGSLQLNYNPELINNTEEVVIEKALEHEGIHVLNKHVSRLLRILANEMDEQKKVGKTKIYNIAADCAANQLMDMPHELIIDGRPWTMCFPDLYDLPEKQTTEFYYEALYKKAEENKNSTGEGDEGIGGEYDQMDDHSEWDKVSSEVADLNALSRKIDSKTQEIIRETLKSFNKRQGKLPAGLAELIDEILQPPKAPYYQIIRKLVKASRYSKFIRHHSKINRKRTYVFAIGDKNIPQISPFPGRTRDLSFDIVLILDTSGSMSKEDIMEGLSGIKNIIENDRYCKVTVLEIDTKIHKEYEVNRISDIQFDILGRGGTRMQPALERAKELNGDVTLCFTDGYCDAINQMKRTLFPKKIIWVIQEDNNGGTINSVKGTGFIVRV